MGGKRQKLVHQSGVAHVTGGLAHLIVRAGRLQVGRGRDVGHVDGVVGARGGAGGVSGVSVVSVVSVVSGVGGVGGVGGGPFASGQYSTQGTQEHLLEGGARVFVHQRHRFGRHFLHELGPFPEQGGAGGLNGVRSGLEVRVVGSMFHLESG